MKLFHITTLSALLLSGSAFSALAQDNQDAYNPSNEPSEKIAVDDTKKKKEQSPLDILAGVAEEKGSVISDIPVDPRVFKINDVVKIRIVESTTATDNAKMESSRETEIDASIEDLIGFTTSGDGVKLKNAIPNFDPAVKMESKVDRDRNATAERKSTLKTFIAAKVVDVKPNGTLVLSASKSITQNEETTTMVLTGIARAEDVSSENVVDSTALADLKLERHGKGELSDVVNRGWFNKLFDAIWPF